MLANEDEYFRGQVEGDVVYGVEGPPGPAGKSAYAYAKENGYTGSESDFSRLLGKFPERIDTAVQSAETAADAAYRAIDALGNTGIPIVNTDNGEVISLNDSAERPLMGMKVYGKTTQNGTPSPDAPVPLDSVGDDGSVDVTVCGKNLINFADAVVANSELGFSHKRAVNLPAGDYIFTCENFTSPTGGTMKGKIVWHDENNKMYYPSSFSQNAPTVRPISVTGTMKQFALYVDKDEGNSYTFVEPMLRLASVTDDTYEPYQEKQTIPISTPNGLPGIPVTSGGNYTDENGQQWICDEVDFEKGVYVQRVGNSVVKAEDITSVDNTYVSTGGAFCHVKLDSTALGSNAEVCVLSDYAKGISNNDRNSYTDSYKCYVPWNGNVMYFRFPVAIGAVTLELAKTVFNGATVVYVLAEEKTIPLPAEQLDAFAALHSIYPHTTVFTEEGAGMEVKYVADTKLYIDKKFDQLAAAMLNN